MFAYPVFIFLILSCFQISAQPLVNHPDRTGSSGKTYALVVGISDYESSGITRLDFAHRDAEEFSNYLKSKAGGSVPEDNIRLLINEQATFAAIYDALNWLLETSGRDDLVYFYFSGHGDMENSTIYKLGFLLSYNTPKSNYINNAVRIEDINNIANTLSVQNNARVVLITDACHSGKLAGSEFRGTFLVGEQLRTVQSKEIRITSCAPDQLSMEDIGWGGGRGVFSYYLVNGLKGLADTGGDGIVSVDEIKKYLDSSMKADALLAQKLHKQNPVIKGESRFQLSVVDSVSLAAIRKGISLVTGQQAQGGADPQLLAPIPVQPQTYLFNLISNRNIEEVVDFNNLDMLRVEEIPFAFIRMVTNKIQQESQGKTEHAPNPVYDQEKITRLESTLRENRDAVERFNNKLVVMFSDRGQAIINQYLEGDEAELERRRYYNSRISGYDIYPKMFSVALKLTRPGDFLQHILKIKLHYFSGVAARLRMPLVSNPSSLLAQALAEQQKALALEENAAYIQNELGILHQFRKEYAQAEKYYIRATRLAPSWAIPWANLAGFYAETSKYSKGSEAVAIADSLQPGLHTTAVNAGYIFEKSGNWLIAEEFYRKSIDINSRHYIPFERLGYVYLQTTSYAEADSFFREAALRKKGFQFAGNVWESMPVAMVLAAMPYMYCDIDTLSLARDDVMAYFTWALQDYKAGDYKNAERIFRKVIAIDKSNPLAFHYLGKTYYDQQNWEAAELMFRFADQYYLDEGEFNRYCDSVKSRARYPYAHDCFEDFFAASHYSQIEDHYFLATLYENWEHYHEAEATYRYIISQNPGDLTAYAKLWRMLEKQGRYTETEKVIQNFGKQDGERSERELNEFYRRMITAQPSESIWPYRLGLLLYERAQAPARAQYLDSVIRFPVQNRELFIDMELYSRLELDPELYIGDQKIKTDPGVIVLETIRERETVIQLPGVNERLHMADAIYTPRKDAITYLSMAAELIAESEIKGDIYFKIGNVYVWAGSKRQAFPFYDRAVKIYPGHISARLSLVDAAASIYKNRAALEQLQNLYATQTINFPNRILLSGFLIHTGSFAEAGKILEEAKNIHPYKLPEISDLNGRRFLLSRQPAQALSYYKDYLASKPDDYHVYYTIARLYAQMGNKTEAWRWLTKSVQKGFDYYWVFKLDDVWNEYRNQTRWKNMIGPIPEDPL